MNMELVAGNDDQRTEEIAVAAGGEEATSHPVQLTPIQDIATMELKVMPAKTSMVSQPLSTVLQPSSMALWPTSTTQASGRTTDPPTALQFMSTT